MATIALLGAAPAIAGDDADRKVAEMLARAHQVYAAVKPRPRCDRSSGEIVVCAPDHGEDQRVPPTSETDPNSREAQHSLDNGQLHAPDLVPHYHGVSVARGCFIQRCPKPQIYIDVAALPKPPEGSDADKIARGEIPAP